MVSRLRSSPQEECNAWLTTIKERKFPFLKKCDGMNWFGQKAVHPFAGVSAPADTTIIPQWPHCGYDLARLERKERVSDLAYSYFYLYCPHQSGVPRNA